MHPLGINAENKNLPVHFMNHSDQEVVIHKHSYVVTMENDQEWNHNIYLSGTSSEPVNQCTYYLNVLEKVTFYLTKINNYTMPLQKTLAYFSLSTIMTMGMLNPSNKEPIEQGTTTKRKSKGK